jgi:hypothetical protein
MLARLLAGPLRPPQALGDALPRMTGLAWPGLAWLLPMLCCAVLCCAGLCQLCAFLLALPLAKCGICAPAPARWPVGNTRGVGAMGLGCCLAPALRSVGSRDAGALSACCLAGELPMRAAHCCAHGGAQLWGSLLH